LLAVCLAVCVHSLPIEPKFRQMALQSQKAETSSEIQAISARIAFLQKLNKLTYDTTLFTRKLRWLLKRSLTEKPSVADVAELMSKELEISKAQIEVAVEGVADELKLEVKQGIIALKAGLAFIEDNYKAGSDPEADAIIAHIKENLKNLEARFGKKFGDTAEPQSQESSTTEVAPPAESSTAEPTPEPSSTGGATPAPESSTTEPTPSPELSSTVSEPAPAASSTAEAAPESSAGSIIEAGVSSTTEVTPTESSTTEVAPPAETTSSTTEVTPPAATSTAGEELPPSVTFESSSSGLNNSNDTSSSSSDLAEEPIAPTGGFFF